MSRKKITDFWLLPFFAGIFVSMGYVSTQRIVLPKNIFSSRELRTPEKESSSSSHRHTSKEIFLKSTNSK